MRITPDHFLLFGHRGCPNEHPENTLPSFQACIDHHIPGVELDVHLTRDGNLVVAHDFSLARTAHTELLIEEQDLSTLQKVNVGAYQDRQERIPLLDEVLELGKGKLYFDIEIKDNSLRGRGLEPLLWKAIQTHGMVDSVLVSSFNPLSVRRFNHASKGKLDTAVIYSSEKGIPKIIRNGRCRHVARATYLKPDWRYARPCHRYPMVAWTVDDRSSLQAMLSLGVRGIISNDAPGILQILREEGSSYRGNL